MLPSDGDITNWNMHHPFDLNNREFSNQSEVSSLYFLTWQTGGAVEELITDVEDGDIVVCVQHPKQGWKNSTHNYKL